MGRGVVPRSGSDGEDEEIRWCEQRFEREDVVPYDRDVDRDPVLVGGAAKDWSKCYVGCEFVFFLPVRHLMLLLKLHQILL